MSTMTQQFRRCLAAMLAFVAGSSPLASAETLSAADIALRLQKAYPAVITAADAKAVTFKDGTTLPLDDGKGPKPLAKLLDDADIEDMFALAYPTRKAITPPAINFDPGRIRNEAFFTKIYGDCRKGATQKDLVRIKWLPGKKPQTLQVTAINGVAERLAAVSRDLDALPAKFDVFLKSPASTFYCRTIAGTDRLSAHGLGIAIDIAVDKAHYWRWTKRRAGAPLKFLNTIPREIVEIFERHGFIWGGRWYHYDTMHFEYRPELLP